VIWINPRKRVMFPWVFLSPKHQPHQAGAGLKQGANI
jgi:hypothetical protein